MMSEDGSDPQSCTLNSDGLPLAVDSSEINDQSSATVLQGNRLHRDTKNGHHLSDKMAQESLVLRGTMKAHTDWVTAIATPIDNSDMIVKFSRDKSIIVWSLTKDGPQYGVPRRRLTGHGHFVQDVVLSSDGMFALSGSWDGELRLWDLQAGTTARRFVGHTKDVLSVAFSVDNRQIVSASRDKTIKLWNTLAQIISSLLLFLGHGLTVKIWNLTNCKLRSTLAGHSGKKLYSLDAGSIIHALCFSPNRYWLCAATESSIKIWDLESKSIVVDLKVDLKQESEMSQGTAAAATAAAKNKLSTIVLQVLFRFFKVFESGCNVSFVVSSIPSLLAAEAFLSAANGHILHQFELSVDGSTHFQWLYRWSD
ncbi:hypothetical protein HAX54_023770 [Datura stramonium]|uniref:Uncharacterized protein n=1 Tax=Datura stramonium TaxID=4076 RepID=A0ABS8UZS8_DATST|nr:hypothetical protein [Datura stramonium]